MTICCTQFGSLSERKLIPPMGDTPFVELKFKISMQNAHFKRSGVLVVL